MCRPRLETKMSNAPAEPARRGAVVRDRNGDVWQRGASRWTCMKVMEGGPVQHLARQTWEDVWKSYGPLVEQPDAALND
jgi:hypothetical protein